MPLVVMGLTSGNSGRQRQNRFGPIQSLDLALFIYAHDNGPVRRIQIQAHDIPHFSTNCGSLENLKFSTRCGCNPNACQIRTIAFCDSPVSAAMSRVLQWVLLLGISSSVLV